MMFRKKWMHVTALSLALPSTIFFVGYFLFALVDQGVFSRLVALLIFIAIVGNTLFLIIWYAIKNKN
jgi:hypothetical protein